MAPRECVLVCGLAHYGQEEQSSFTQDIPFKSLLSLCTLDLPCLHAGLEKLCEVSVIFSPTSRQIFVGLVASEINHYVR